MRSKKINILASIVLLLLVYPISGWALTLSVSNAVARPGQVVMVYIDADDISEIAGVVFTISYDTASLELQEITDGGFFDGFAYGVEIAGQGRRINGARRHTGAWPGHLLTLKFRVKSDNELQGGEITGDYEIKIQSSDIYDPEAGYDPAETLPMAWGLDPSQDPLQHPELAFPIFQVSVVPGTISIDRDGDGLTDTREENLGTNKDNPDTDGDGMPDGWEVTANLDPLEKEDAFSDWDNDGYSNLREYISATDPNSGLSRPSGLIADLDGDEDVDGLDVWKLAGSFEQEVCPGDSCVGDLDGDGVVNTRDMRLFLEEFGK